MADNTPSSGSHMLPYRTHHGHTMIRQYPESTGSTFGMGDVLELGATTNSHRCLEASSLSTAYAGVAMQAASSNQDEMVSVAEAHGDQEFLGWYKGVIASSLIGAGSTGYRSIARDSTLGIDYVADNSSAADQRIQITDVLIPKIDGQAIGDTGGWVAFRFLPEFTVFGKST